MTVQKRRYLFDGLTVCVTHDVAVNLESCTCIVAAELPVDHLWRSSRIEKKGRVGLAEGVKAAPWESERVQDDP